EQARIAARCGRIDGDDPFSRKAIEVMRATGFGPRTRQTFAAEGLGTDHRAYLIAVNINVADLGAAADLLSRTLDAGMDAQCQAVAGQVHLLEELVQSFP